MDAKFVPLIVWQRSTFCSQEYWNKGHISIDIHCVKGTLHYCDIIMCAMASQITSLTIIYSNVYSGVDQRK